MKLIIGLGNPGKKYEDNRHNVGFMVVDAIATRDMRYEKRSMKLIKRVACYVLRFNDILLAKPTTFMNDSGRAVKKLVDFYKIKRNDLYVIHDDLDIKLGEYKIQKGRGPKLHNGIESINQALGNRHYWRIRVGIENRPPSNLVAQQPSNPDTRIPGESYVLQDFTKEEQKIVRRTISKLIGQLKKTYHLTSQ